MILTIKGADFSSANIGTLSTYVVSKSIGRGATYEIPGFISKNSSANWTITLEEGYIFGTYSVTMGGEPVEVSVADNVMTISIAEVTGNVRISVATINQNAGETITVRTTTNSHANPKTLPGIYPITSNTNLIGMLPQTDGEYYLAGGWGPAENISAITFPVIPGDRITGVTFGTNVENGSSVNGTRTTFLMNDTVVKSIAPPDIYAEYKNNGYITVPDGVNCVSIPFTTNAAFSKKEIRLLTI